MTSTITNIYKGPDRLTGAAGGSTSRVERAARPSWRATCPADSGNFFAPDQNGFFNSQRTSHLTHDKSFKVMKSGLRARSGQGVPQELEAGGTFSLRYSDPR